MRLGEKSFYFLSGQVVSGPTTFEQIEADVVAGVLPRDLLVAYGPEGRWRSLDEYIEGEKRHAFRIEIEPNASEVHAGTRRSVIDSVNAAVNKAAGLDKVEGFRFADFLGEIFKRHPKGDAERNFCVGSSETTPQVSTLRAEWPRPWMFSRILLFSGAVYLLFLWSWNHFHNTNLIPAVLIVGSFAIPLSVLVLFFELNAWRNASLYLISCWFLAGGVLSLVFSLIFFDAVGEQGFQWFGATLAGPVEELAKVLTAALVVRERRHSSILTGLLAGAAVGAGFAAFESAGYALRFFGFGFVKGFLSLEKAVDTMTEVITLRGGLAPLCHIPWTAVTSAALWAIRDKEPFRLSMIIKGRFLRVLSMIIAIHMVWNSEYGSSFPFFSKYIVLGVVVWILVIAFVQRGVRQLEEEILSGSKNT